METCSCILYLWVIVRFKERGEELDTAREDISQLEEELKQAQQDLAEKTNEVTQFKKDIDILNNNEELNNNQNGKLLEASKRQGNYAYGSLVLSGAFAVGASLTMLHLAICISFAVAALTSLVVGCYCSHKANTALSNVEVGQIGNGIRSLVVE